MMMRSTCSRTRIPTRSQPSCPGSSARLNEDEQLDLVTLMWLGRGDGELEEWDDLRARAAEARGEYKNPRRETVQYLLGEPMLGDLLADGMDELGIDWTDERTTPVS
ncbi:hypothetical protein M2190_006679 [Bradyrhizobium japonicum]|nr:hypothetical protein [Bradyrhizobium japonicum]